MPRNEELYRGVKAVHAWVGMVERYGQGWYTDGLMSGDFKQRVSVDPVDRAYLTILCHTLILHPRFCASTYPIQLGVVELILRIQRVIGEFVCR